MFTKELKNEEVKRMNTKENAVVATYDTHTEAEEAVEELQRSGFDMKKLSNGAWREWRQVGKD
jgi:hypothetical protein